MYKFLRPRFSEPAYAFCYFLVASWGSTDTETHNFTARSKAKAAVSEYYNASFSGCRADMFEMRSMVEMCWGGYVIIGVSSAVTILVIIAVGVGTF